MERVERILLVPGLLEPRISMWPLKWRLGRQGAQVEIWRDRYIYRSLEGSVSRLADTIAEETRPLTLVTHSFGDWVARAAIARCPEHRIDALVSVAPVIATGPIPVAMHLLTAGTVPELQVMMDPSSAGSHLNPDPSVRRMLIWARIDHFVRSVPDHEIPDARIVRVAATHLSVILHPGACREIEQFVLGTC